MLRPPTPAQRSRKHSKHEKTLLDGIKELVLAGRVAKKRHEEIPREMFAFPVARPDVQYPASCRR